MLLVYGVIVSLSDTVVNAACLRSDNFSLSDIVVNAARLRSDRFYLSVSHC